MEFLYKSKFSDQLKGQFYTLISLKVHYMFIFVFILFMIYFVSDILVVQNGLLYNFLIIFICAKILIVPYVIVIIGLVTLNVFIESIRFGEFNEELHCKIDHYGIVEIAKRKVVDIEWNSVKKVIINKDVILVFPTKGVGWLLNKSAVGKEKFQQVQELIHKYYR